MAYCFNLKCPAPDVAGKGNFCIHCGASLRLDDRYEALRSLKSYANGGTFVCHDRQQRQCVIKKISLQRPGQPNKSWEQEIKAIKTISTHPQIPDLWEHFFDLDHHYLYLVQEFIEGKSIDQELYDGPQVEALLLEILPLLHFIHSHGVTHRDLNPQNLLRSSRSDHRLFLVDLSTAKVSAKTSLGRAGTTIGSAAYTAPEQLYGQSCPASDLYSLGLITIHLLTQMNPLDLLSGADGISAWQDYLPEPISPLLVQVINGMVAESLTDRYSQALTIIKLLNPNFQEGDSFNFEQGDAPLGGD
ncbi:MAG: protein kinase [Synechococcaceae cyanobacterium RL_1_2]|nr:protein kinase [Synechococcaceae cyanobacterium RL_1_2]